MKESNKYEQMIPCNGMESMLSLKIKGDCCGIKI